MDAIKCALIVECATIFCKEWAYQQSSVDSQSNRSGPLLVMLSQCVQNTLAQQRKACSPVSHSLDKLQLIHMPFDQAVVMR